MKTQQEPNYLTDISFNVLNTDWTIIIKDISQIFGIPPNYGISYSALAHITDYRQIMAFRIRR